MPPSTASGFATIRRTPTCAFREPGAARAGAAPVAVLPGDLGDARARGGARPRGRGISGPACNRIRGFDRLTGERRRNGRRRGAHGASSGARLALPGKQLRRLLPAASLDFSTSTICWSSRAAAPRGRRPRCWGRRRCGGARGSFSESSDRPFSNSFRFPLSIPGEVAVPGWALSAARIEEPEEVTPPPARGNTAVVAAAPSRPLAVRSRRPGDVFRPLGMHGRGRKLQDFLVDRKIARADRDSSARRGSGRPDRLGRGAVGS